MKQIKIKFAGFWANFNPEEFFLLDILRKHYNVEICDDADYVICSGFNYFEYVGHKQVRIMFSGENYVPDFNHVDYGISVYPVEYLDRHFSFPGLVLVSYDFLLELSQKDRAYSKEILNEKPYFMNLIASHESEKNIRGEMFRLLSEYKRVEAAGSLFNNMPNGARVQMRDGTKRALQQKCKFTFCGESMDQTGFITEKIFDAFLADTIPVYYGSSTISEIVNKNAYIDLRDYETLEAAVEKIIQLDQDDEAYMEMLRQPVFVQADYVENKIADLEAFICNIFDQPIEKAYRRSRMYMPMWYENEILKWKRLQNNAFSKLYCYVKKKCIIAFWRVVELVMPIKERFFKKR